MRRGENGLLEYIEINVNKIQTRILYNGTIFVEQRMFVFIYSILLYFNSVKLCLIIYSSKTEHIKG